MFGLNKKPKKTPEELKKEREDRILNTEKSLKLQIIALDKKKDNAFALVMDARRKGLPEQENAARNHLKQVMAASKRANGMLLTLQIAMETRDLAELSANFVNSIGDLADDILFAEKDTSNAKIQKTQDKFLKAQWASNQQKERIDNMMDMGEYASVSMDESANSVEFDDEIDSMINSAEIRGNYSTNGMKGRM